MNSSQIIIMKQTMDLSETIFQGLQFADAHLDAGQIEESMEIMSGVLEGMGVIDRALPKVLRQLPENELAGSTDHLKEVLEYVKNSYVEGNFEQAGQVVKQLLIPAYIGWQHEIFRNFSPYILH